MPLKLQPAIFPLSQHVIRFHEIPADTTQRFLHYGSSYQILYINILVDWKHITRESESPRPAASSILISRMTRSSVIIPYIVPTTQLRRFFRVLLAVW